MKGFEIIFNGKKQSVCVENGLLIIHIVTIADKDSNIHVYASDNTSNQKFIWENYSPITEGDTFQISCIDVQKADTPVMISPQHSRSKLKLETFFRIESLLKEKGIL